jgi:glycosyltransferase involved in cell wall biosynthesis
MRPPRILMLSDTYFPRVNGVSTSIQTFRRALAALGCESVLLAPQYPKARADEPGVVRVRSRRVPLDPEDRMIAIRELERATLELRAGIDLIHIQTPFVAHVVGTRAARLIGVPAVETYHTLFEEYAPHYLPVLPKPLLRAATRAFSRHQCNAVHAVVAPSPQMAHVLRSYGVRSTIDVVPTGLDLGQLAGGDGERFRAQHGISPDRPVALTVGRVAFEKNLEFLLAVLARLRASLPDVLLVIAGEGPALAALQRSVADSGLAGNVRFVGNLDRSGPLLDCYRSANAFVFASKTETQGLVLLEAMALGVPVVSTAVLGTRFVLDGARGAIVVEEDEAGFASALQTVLTDRNLRVSLAAEARRFVAERWSSIEMAKRLLVLYERVCNSMPPLTQQAPKPSAARQAASSSSGSSPKSARECHPEPGFSSSTRRSSRHIRSAAGRRWN